MEVWFIYATFSFSMGVVSWFAFKKKGSEARSEILSNRAGFWPFISAFLLGILSIGGMFLIASRHLGEGGSLLMTVTLAIPFAIGYLCAPEIIPLLQRRSPE